MTYELLRTPAPDADRSDETSTTEAVVAAVFPLLRGWLHLVCFFLSVPAGLVVVASASPRDRGAAIVYAIGLSALFGVSAAYHRGRWSATARPRMKRADHATIFVMIAGSYTPLCLVALGGSLGRTLMLVVWLAAGTGVVLAATGIAEKPIVGSITYVGLGWLMVLVLPELTRRLSPSQLVLIVVGGLLYTVGSVFLATHWPDPFPTVFGYHEIWHVMVVAGAVCHYVAILSVVKAAA